AEAGTDNDVVVEGLPAEDISHDASVGVVGVDPDQGVAHHLGGADRILDRQRMGLGNDAVELAFGERHELDGGVLEGVAHGHQLTLVQHDIINRFFDLEDVQVCPDVWVALASQLYGARHHHVRDARHRADAQLETLAGFHAIQHAGEIVDPAVDRVELLEHVSRIRGRNVASLAPVEDAQTEATFRVLHESANAGCRDSQQLGSAGNAAGDHHSPENLDLAEGQHVERPCLLENRYPPLT